jgi:hypothetical protein
MPLLPNISDKLYIAQTDQCDIVGGIATISALTFQYGDPFVAFVEFPGIFYNYRLLLLEQDGLKKLYGKDKASFTNTGKAKEIARLRLLFQDTKKNIEELKSSVFSSADLLFLKSITRKLERLEKKL